MACLVDETLLQFCDLLGLNPHQIAAMNIRLRPGQFPRINIVFVPSTLDESAIKRWKSFVLQLIPREEPVNA